MRVGLQQKIRDEILDRPWDTARRAPCIPLTSTLHHNYQRGQSGQTFENPSIAAGAGNLNVVNFHGPFSRLVASQRADENLRKQKLVDVIENEKFKATPA